MKSILIVDDEPDEIKVFKHRFAGLPYVIYEAYDGETALALIRRIKPALVILDVTMPVMNGLEVCKKVREEELENAVATPLPIIMLSGRDEDVDKIVGKVVGANYYLTKPCNVDELKALVEKIVKQQNSESVNQ